MFSCLPESCKFKNLIPSNLKCSPPIRSSREFKLAKKFSIQFLKLRIAELHQKIRNLQMEKEKLENELQTELDVHLYQLLSQHIQISKSYQIKQVSTTHQKKLNGRRKKDHLSSFKITTLPKQNGSST